MLSILIPTYNTDVTKLVNQLNQLCLLTNLTYEICIIDDASNIQVLNTVFSHVNYSKNPKNLGRTATRNLLAKNAKYHWLLFLDADVIPTNDNFIKDYIDAIHKERNSKIIFGGIDYLNTVPEKDKILRWKYGKEREAKSVKERLKAPEFIISQNLLIHKNTFLQLNRFHENLYGIDNIFSNLIKKENIAISHIHNTVYHLGLENSSRFLEKSLKAIDTTIYFENKNVLDNNSRPIQKAYLQLKKKKITPVFYFLISVTKPLIKWNLLSTKPNLVLFDLYRLWYYVKLKRTNQTL